MNLQLYSSLAQCFDTVSVNSGSTISGSYEISGTPEGTEFSLDTYYFDFQKYMFPCNIRRLTLRSGLHGLQRIISSTQWRLPVNTDYVSDRLLRRHAKPPHSRSTHNLIMTHILGAIAERILLANRRPKS